MSRQLALPLAAPTVTPRPLAGARPVSPRAVRATGDPCPEAPRPFVGAPVVCADARRCAVCGTPITPERDGIMVICDRWAAHVGCGIVRTKR